MDYDVLIIGGGPAGSKCAMELGHAGKKVGLIEKNVVGGVCLNRGCIPSKTYLYLVELLENFKKAKRHGIELAAEPKIIWEQVKKRKNMNVRMLGMGLSKAIECAGVEMINGQGELSGPNEVTVKTQEGEKQLTAKNIVLALGSKPLFTPIMPKGEHVVSSTEMLDLDEIPKSLVIIGGGVTGVEMASVFSALGTEVTIVELQESLLPSQDKEITAVLKKSLEKKGCKINLNSQVLSAKDKNGQAEVVLKNPEGEEQVLMVDKALVVIGRTINYDLEALASVGITNDGRLLELNENLQTSLPNVYMIGDSAFRNLTAYAGEREGECVAADILGHERKINYSHVPVTVFSHPEVASIGLTEEQATEKGLEYEVKTSDYAANAKAIIMSEREGMVKILIEKSSQKILGVHMVGAHAADLIHQAILPVMQEMTVKEWLEVIWSHPVLSELLKSALEA